MNAELRIWDIPGGIHPPEQMALSNRTPIIAAPLPARLIVPLAQHIGAPAEPCVQVGEQVLKGQLIAAANGLTRPRILEPGTLLVLPPLR